MRHGAALQGDLEGEPGRDPEVHHQGANHALREHWSALLLLALAGCSSTPASPEAPAASAAPTQGTIIYHEPVPQQSLINQRGTSKRPKRPVTEIVTAAPDDSLADDGPYRTYTGTIGGVERGQSISSQDWSRAVGKLLEQTGKSNARVLKSARFQALWRALEEAEIFKLPAYRGAGRPRDEPHFILQTGDREWVFARPAYVDTPDPNDPQVQQLRVWNSVKLAFFDFLQLPE